MPSEAELLETPDHEWMPSDVAWAKALIQKLRAENVRLTEANGVLHRRLKDWREREDADD